MILRKSSQSMQAGDKKRTLHRLLVSRVLQGPGWSSASQRASAFDNAEVAEPLRVLVEKVATKSQLVTDADFHAAKDAGFSDDHVFELVVCAAVGESTRQYEAGLAALAQAVTESESG